LDAHEETFERYHSKLIKDRPLVYARVEDMPFKDNAFDFVIASHVLEHVSDPEKFLLEMMRVGKAGYIETPDAFIERLIPFRFHRLEVTELNGILKIYKKPSWRPHSEIVDLFERKVKNKYFIKLMQTQPKAFYVRYYWQNKIDYEIMNPEVDANWAHPPLRSTDHLGNKSPLRKYLALFLRYIFSQNIRNKKINLMTLLRCVECHGSDLKSEANRICCNGCGKLFQINQGSPVMIKDDA
jgi:SAM-dependent methyltransferase